jgi:hypothetical protein
MTGIIILRPLDSIGYIAVDASDHDDQRLIVANFLRAAKTEYGSVNEGAIVHPYIDRSHKGEFIRAAGFEGLHVEERP